MIKPTFSFKQQNAIEFDENIFVDRLPAREKFQEFISGEDKDLNILMYYGVGGVGKSSLLAENIAYFKKNTINPLCFHVDLNDVNKRSIGAAIQEFVDDCSNSKIRFDAFNLAYALYFGKKHSGEEYGRDKRTINSKLDVLYKFIGIWDDGKVEVVANLISKVVDYARKNKLPKAILGLIHDAAYEFVENQEEHEHKGGEILRSNGYRYWKEVYYHGNPDSEYDSAELRLLNRADMTTGPDGKDMTIDERLADIAERYGETSSQYINAKLLANKINI